MMWRIGRHRLDNIWKNVFVFFDPIFWECALKNIPPCPDADYEWQVLTYLSLQSGLPIDFIKERWDDHRHYLRLRQHTDTKAIYNQVEGNDTRH